MVSGRGFRALSVFQSIPKLIGQRAKGWPGFGVRSHLVEGTRLVLEQLRHA
jgi:hypothetical protein